jgi:hypothetical protein
MIATANKGARAGPRELLDMTIEFIVARSLRGVQMAIDLK